MLNVLRWRRWFILKNQLIFSLLLWYTFSIEISTGSEVNEDLHGGVEISLGTPGGGLKDALYI